jgi:sialidase-1
MEPRPRPAARLAAAAVAILAAAAVARTAHAAPWDPVDLFVAGVPPLINNYRIPALVRTRTGTLIAVAEARTAMADCCFKYLVFRRSTDNGTTWSDVAPVWGANLTDNQGAGNPVLVHDNTTGVTFLHGSVNDPTHCSPTLWTFQLDDGGTDGARWGNLKPLAPFLGQYDGATPGPGTGTQLGPSSPAPGRLLVPAHYGVYNLDVTWYSDDHGETWALSTPPLPHLDEVVVAALPSGKVMLNARTDHYNSSCDCRAVTTSSDGGKTWDTPVSWDATLIEPVCQASLVTIGPLASAAPSTPLFFANPASTTDRANITVRRSDDEGQTWLPGTWLVQPGEVWGAYSCIAPGAPLRRKDAGDGSTDMGAIVFERTIPSGPPGSPLAGETTTVISFALFPVDPVSSSPRTFISASHPSVQWEGRTRVNPDGSVSFDLPAVTATMVVQGATYFEAQFSSTCGTSARMESSVDGSSLNTTSPNSFNLYPSFTYPHSVPIFSGLDPSGGPHTFRLRHATEARWDGCLNLTTGVTLTGVWTDGVPVAPGPAPSRRIEWVGDSITAGFGTAPEGSKPACSSTLNSEDASRAAPVQVCAALGAACSVVAVSGDTVLPFPIPAPAVKPPLPIVYTRSLTYDANPDSAWDFSAWVPDAIVLNLGTNDFAEPNYNASYVPSLVSFLLQLTSEGGWYGPRPSPNATLPKALLYCGPMQMGYCQDMERSVQLAVAAGANAVFLGPVTATLDGCDGHPGPLGQAQMAATLGPLVQKAMGW